MLNPQQNKKLLKKLETCLSVYDGYIFVPIKTLDYKMYQTNKHLRQVPRDDLFCEPTKEWGGEGATAWFKTEYCPDAALDGKPLYIMPRVGGYEGMLWVNGTACGTFATKIVVTRHGNHYCDLLVKKAQASKKILIAIEFYAGHYVKGCQPFEDNINTGFVYPCGEIMVCVKQQLVSDFIYDLRILLQLAQLQSVDEFRKAQVLNALYEVHKVLVYSPSQVSDEEWQQSLQKAMEIMKPILDKKNGDSAPTAWLVGHSHMDTAWLWPVDETIRKNARTISNQLSLMEQFSEYRFIQSSSCHSAMMEKEYPDIFERMKLQIANGRYEPNGAVWVECDCNLTGGEALIRQFLWGQRYTKEKFGYLADAFWLPDTFGYSAAIPQIMKGVGVKYFLTTKLAWNDTNTFPYESFVWEGIDKSQVLTHFFVMDTWTDPHELSQRMYGNGYADCLHNKQTGADRLVAFGFGDGGGGPQFEMIELARRLQNVEGCPKTLYTSVSDFMQRLEKRQTKLPVYKGELYLELHRGTLTGKQQIKKNNRTAEILLHNVELLTVLVGNMQNEAPADTEYRTAWEALLKNQFHDILPGSCIPIAHNNSIAEMNEVIQQLISLQQKLAKRLEKNEKDGISVCNTAGVCRSDVVYLHGVEESFDPEQKLSTQMISLQNGENVLAIGGLTQKEYTITPVTLTKGKCIAQSKFKENKNRLETPFYTVEFTSEGFIKSLITKHNQRELCGGMPLNTFLMAEDVPAGWDGWDIDADCFDKLTPCASLEKRSVISAGAVEYRIRSEYKIGDNSHICQDIIFYTHSPLITFDTTLVWNEKHRLLKTAFDTSIQSAMATHEIQFGSIHRPTTRNNSYEQAMFEVCNHKYTDISEPSGGVTLLNNCKYGISADGGKLMLSLAKGGLRPDDRGDQGEYTFKYGFLPHEDCCKASNVIVPSYCFNYDTVQINGTINMPSFLSTNHDNVIIETIKPCEDAQNAFIARIYESEGSYTKANINLPCGSKAVICDMLEQEQQPLNTDLTFAPFEIKTIKIYLVQ